MKNINEYVLQVELSQAAYGTFRNSDIAINELTGVGAGMTSS